MAENVNNFGRIFVVDPNPPNNETIPLEDLFIYVKFTAYPRSRTTYNGRLKRIAKRIGVDKITSHVSRHSFAYYMLSTGASVEEISFALGHASIEITQSYIKQFPSRYSDEAISRFGASFNV